jgi:hypothetical protein
LVVLHSPLSQVLGETRGGEETRYLYERARLASLDAASARTWHLHDVLGGVRLHAVRLRLVVDAYNAERAGIW